MPTATDEKLASDLTDFRVEVEKRFGSIDAALGEFRVEVRTQLGFIKWIGVFFASVLVALVGGAVNVAWNASALNSEVKTQGARLDKVEGRLDAMARQLETIIRQTAPKAGG